MLLTAQKHQARPAKPAKDVSVLYSSLLRAGRNDETRYGTRHGCTVTLSAIQLHPAMYSYTHRCTVTLTAVQFTLKESRNSSTYNPAAQKVPLTPYTAALGTDAMENVKAA